MLVIQLTAKQLSRWIHACYIIFSWILLCVMPHPHIITNGVWIPIETPMLPNPHNIVIKLPFVYTVAW